MGWWNTRRPRRSTTGPPGWDSSQAERAGYETSQLRKQVPGRDARAHRITSLYDQSLANPRKTADMFKGGFDQYARSWAAPQQREFANTIGGVAGNVASRFGGNASSEEQRQVGAASSDFSRHLTEGIARLAPEVFQAGAQYTSQLGDASENAQDRADRIRQMILAGVLGVGDEPDSNLLGQLLGGAAGAVLGGPGGAAIGSQVFG